MAKAEKLEKYDLDWWTPQLKPLLEEFIQTAKGNIDKSFWRNMFKKYTQGYCGSSTIDGWIVKFFPYDKRGNRKNLKEMGVSGKNLPNEMIKVDFKFIDATKKPVEKTMMELWAGFIGLKQDPSDFSLTPKIGWMVRKKDRETAHSIFMERLKKQSKYGIQIRVNKFPSELLKLKSIGSLTIKFTDAIQIPDAIKRVKIGRLYLTGAITDKGIKRIKQLLPYTEIEINHKKVQEIKEKK